MEFDDAYFGEDESVNKCNVTLRITGDFTDASLITQSLQIEPTKAFGKGEEYQTKRNGIQKRPIGHWSISSEKLDSTSVEKHCEYLLEIAELNKESIRQYINNPKVWVSVVFWWESKTGHGGFSISPDKATRLAQLCQDFRFHFL